MEVSSKDVVGNSMVLRQFCEWWPPVRVTMHVKEKFHVQISCDCSPFDATIIKFLGLSL